MRKEYIESRIDEINARISNVQIMTECERKKGKLLEVRLLEQKEAKLIQEKKEWEAKLEVANGI